MPQLIEREIDTPLGAMVAGVVRGTDAWPDGLCLLEFHDRRALPRERADLERTFGCTWTTGTDPIIDEAESQIVRYFAAERIAFDMPLTLPGTEFQRRVWQALLRIPHGETVSYSGLARTIGTDPATTSRAVARANGSNRVAVVVPCHRVIGADGSLVGYAGGLDRKRRLLEIEGALAGLFAESAARSRTIGA